MLQVEKIGMTYGNGNGVFDLSFDLSSGEVLGLLGANGSGKTTTFRMLLGLLEKEQGRIIFEGVERLDIPRLIGYLPEERSLLKDLKVKDHVWYLASLKKMKKETFEEEYKYWEEYFQISHVRDKKVGILSKGNQQKVQLLCALIHHPKIYIFDEPFSGLDLENQELFRRLIFDLKEQGKYIILSTHSFQYLEQYCDQIVCIKKGRITLNEKMKHLKQRMDPCIVLHKNDVHEALWKKVECKIWEEQNDVWIQANEKGMKEISKRCLYYGIKSYTLGVYPIRKCIEEAMHE